MNMTSSAFWPRASSRRTILPVMTSVSAKSGASVPSFSMVDSVSAIAFLLENAINFLARIHRMPVADSLKQSRLPSRHGDSKMFISQPCGYPAARRAVQKADLDEERLVD